LTANTGREIQSLARGLTVIGMLADSDRPIGVTELAAELGIHKSAAFRLLNTLVNHGFAVQDPTTRRYEPGLRIVEISRAVLDRFELRAAAKPYLKQLQKLTGESAHLAVRQNSQAVYIDQEDSAATLSVNTEIGRTAPLYCTALGKALIAHLGPEELDDCLGDAPLKRYTPRTATTRQELDPHLTATRERGYALDDEEFSPGVRCLAVPVRDFRGKVVAAVGISGPSSRVTFERIADLSETVMDIARQISHQAGHKG
jgi:DNA-binding IclR family transcriptional regulator